MLQRWLQSMGATQSANFPYVIGDVVPSYTGRSIWALHKGTKKDDGSPVSIFNFDIKKSPNKVEVAKNGFKRAKTIRHPNVLTFLDGLEMETNIYIVTEEVFPLEDKLEECKDYVNSISWGLYQVTKAVSFISNDCNLVHGNISPASIFLTKAGDWKLGGLDLVCDIKEPNCIFKNHNDTAEKLYKPPEVMKGNWSQIHANPAWCIDIWMLGCLIYELYNGKLSRQEELKELGKIPKSLVPQYQQIFTSNPQSRSNPKTLLDKNITLKDNFEKENFFKKLDKLLDEFPSNISKYKILPHLITALDFGSANPRVLGPLLKIGAALSTEEYTQKVTPSVVKWFGSNDRALRINLLENLEHFAHHLTPGLINDQIFPSVVTGFTDLSPVLRELTVKSMLHLVPKMSERIINTQLLKYFAKLQMDQEPGIRTNTTICLGKISQYLSEDTRKRVLVPAFSRALRDPFPPARIAGLMAFTATKDYFDKEECATKIIPVLATIMIDSEKQVRTIATQAVKLFISKLEKMTELMSEGTHAESSPAAQLGAQEGSGMLGWAFTTLSKKIYGEGENPNIQPQSPPIRSPISAPIPSQKEPPIKEQQSKKSKDGWDDFEAEEEAHTPKFTQNNANATQSRSQPLVLGNKQGNKAKTATNSNTSTSKFSFTQDGWDDGWDDTPPPKGAQQATSDGWDTGAANKDGWEDDGWESGNTKKDKGGGWDDNISDKDGWNDNAKDKGNKSGTTKKDTNGWDDEEDWEEFSPKPAQAAKSQAAKSQANASKTSTEPKLTKMELAQLKKEEQMKRANKNT